MITPTPSPWPSPWLSAYVAFSRTWSPRAYEGFHTACALWLLSTIAARRVVLHLGKSYYIALVARTSLYSKSTTAGIALDTLAAADLDWLLAPDNSTPQRFIRDLSLRLPEHYAFLSPQQQERVHLRLALTAQRGWFYDEFGQQLASLGRESGSLSDFRSMLRRFDDCKERYEVATITRGSDVVLRPYLALLANMTPADMASLARRGALLWNDGFWARFAFVAPPADEPPAEMAMTRFPDGKRIIPTELVAPLVAWHTRLGMPKLSIGTSRHRDPRYRGPVISLAPSEPVPITLGSGVKDAFYAYHNELVQLTCQSNQADLDGSYARLPEKALRVAMLLASLENDNHLELAHWRFACQIAEDWRANLHALYDQLNAPASGPAAPGDAGLDPSEPPQPPLSDRLIAIVRRHPHSTASEVARYVRGLDVLEAKEMLNELTVAGKLEAVVSNNSLHYSVL